MARRPRRRRIPDGHGPLSVISGGGAAVRDNALGISGVVIVVVGTYRRLVAEDSRFVWRARDVVATRIRYIRVRLWWSKRRRRAAFTIGSSSCTWRSAFTGCSAAPAVVYGASRYRRSNAGSTARRRCRATEVNATVVHRAPCNGHKRARIRQLLATIRFAWLTSGSETTPLVESILEPCRRNGRRYKFFASEVQTDRFRASQLLTVHLRDLLADENGKCRLFIG